MHHKRNGQLLTQGQEEILLIGGFGLFWVGKSTHQMTRPSRVLDMSHSCSFGVARYHTPQYRHGHDGGCEQYFYDPTWSGEATRGSFHWVTPTIPMHER
jgi:hypothetical protein